MKNMKSSLPKIIDEHYLNMPGRSKPNLKSGYKMIEPDFHAEKKEWVIQFFQGSLVFKNKESCIEAMTYFDEYS